MKSKSKKLALHWQVIIGLVLGAVYAWFAVANGWITFTMDYINPFGNIFINLLNMSGTGKLTRARYNYHSLVLRVAVTLRNFIRYSVLSTVLSTDPYALQYGGHTYRFLEYEYRYVLYE